MAVTARWYTLGAGHFMTAEIDWLATAVNNDDIWMALMVTAYTPAIDTDEFFNVIDGDEHGETGTYAAGGKIMTIVDAAVVQDTAVSPRADTTAYVVGDLVRPSSANGYIYRCIVAGTSGTGEPSWTTSPGLDTEADDATLIWENVGTSYVKLDADNMQWAASTLDADYGVIYAKGGTPGTDDFLIALIDFDGTETSSAGDFDVVFDDNGVLQAFISL
jgi:hypothetical protein